MKRVSSYTIFVPLGGGQGYILVHGYTGALDQVDSNLATQLLCWSKTGREISASAIEPDTLAYLEERGFLTDMTPGEETEFLHDFAIEIHQRLKKSGPHIYIMPTYECQLRCTYCFERTIQNTAQQAGWFGTVMSAEVIDAAYKAIDQLNADKTKKSIELYGGEPLLRKNRACVETIVKRGRERGYVFLAATNGVDLDAYLDLLALDQIACVQIPVDGGLATHNKYRCYPDGSPSFAQIMQNVQRAAERNIHIRLRVNATRDTLQYLNEFVDALKAYDLFSYPRFSCYFKALFPSTKLTDKLRRSLGYVSEAEVIQKISEYPELVSRATGYPIIDSRVKALFESQVLSALSPVHCGAATNIYVFDPLGNTYPCNNVVGYPQHAIGRFWPVFEWNEQTRGWWHQRSIENIPECLQCKYALLCGGGCLYRTLVDNENLYASHCDNFSNTFKTLILLYYQQYYP